MKPTQKPVEHPPTLARYLELLDTHRQLARYGRPISREERAPIDAEMRKILNALTPDEQAAAAEQNWRRNPVEFDAREASCMERGVPARDRPPMSFDDIPQFPHAAYEIDVSWMELERHLARWSEAYKLNLEPEFQRAHVWTAAQQTAYVEYQLRGGEVGKLIIFSHPNWNSPASHGAAVEIVDGKQRLEAVRAFLRGDVVAFGRTFQQFRGRPDLFRHGFRWRVVSLNSRADLLQLYLSINAGGTPHTAAELNKVRGMLARAAGA
jgi:hypothetical protein